GCLRLAAGPAPPGQLTPDNDAVTLVHRRLWPAFLTVAASGESWQLDGLSTVAREMLDSVNGSREPVRGRGAVVKELEGRLLEVVLQSWADWARKAKVKRLRVPAAARQRATGNRQRKGDER
ncbi:MAG TPA: hypothetical protein VGF28_12705, partial [Thermoanaerobaculia bacterium]